MKIVEERNDLRGRSYYLLPEGSDDAAEILAKLTSEERTILADPNGYFRARSGETDSPPVRRLLNAIASGTYLHCEIHDARFEPALNATYFAFRLSTGSHLLLGARRLPLPTGLPSWLRPLYQQIGATREKRWPVAGGFQFAHRPDGLPPASEYAPDSPVWREDVIVFFDTLYGDSAGYLPDGRCVWYLHETESLQLEQEPTHLIARMLESHLSGEPVVAPRL